MHRRQVEIVNQLDLHLRAANRFVEHAQRFQAEIQVFFDGKAANGKSVLDLLLLAAGRGALVELELAGPDAAEAGVVLAALIEARFHEDHEPVPLSA